MAGRDDGVLLREDGTAKWIIGKERERRSPTVVARHRLHVGWREIRDERRLRDDLIGAADTGRGVVAIRVRRTSFPGAGDRPHVRHRAALLRALECGQEIWNRNRRDDADDGNDNEKFNERKALLSFQHSLSSEPDPEIAKAIPSACRTQNC